MEIPKLYIIDGHSQMFKAFYAIRNLSNSAGLATNMVFGFAQILNRIFKEYNPEYIAVAFDLPGKTFRNEIYADYKANRDAPPEDFSTQVPYIYQMLEGYGIPVLSKEGYEADDIIATLANQAKNENFEAYIISSDKDLFQLVNGQVFVISLKDNQPAIMGRDQVKEKMGVYPEQMLDFQGLCGDSVDNIPGIPKVGPKTAIKLLDEFGTLENVLQSADKISAKALKQKVAEHADDALMSRELARLSLEVKLDVNLQDLKRKPEDRQALAKLYHTMEFRNYQQQYPLNEKQQAEIQSTAGVSAPEKINTKNYFTVGEEQDLKKWVEKFNTSNLLAFDTETDSSNPMTCNLVGMSLSNEIGTAIYIPMGHATLIDPQIPIESALDMLRPVLENPDIPKSAHNAKYDLKVLDRHGCRIKGLAFDTLLASVVLDSEGRHGLKLLAREILNIQMTEITELIGSGRNQVAMSEVEIEKAAPYACMDADITLRLTEYFKNKIDKSDVKNLFYDIEMPLVEILHDMEMQGIAIDTDYFKKLSKDFEGELQKLAKKIYELVGRVFTINSPKQVSQILFDELELPTDKVKKGKSGVYSTDVSVLEMLASKHPLPKLLLEFRQFEKLKSTYVDPLPTMRNPNTGHLHTNYNQSGAATGRLSSNNPNLQNIPVRTKYGRMIRRGFIPGSENNVLLAADYSQVELRILAHVTGDEALVQAFNEGMDIHSLTALKIFGVEPQDQDKQMRSQAKVVNFGIIYGMSAFRLSNELEIPRAKADQFIKDYFAAYPSVKAWKEKIIEETQKSGYVTTMTNRKRSIREINSRNSNLRFGAERIAINTPIQGSAADMIKMAMVQVQNKLASMEYQCKMILQVHDELIFDLPENEVDELQPVLTELMENAMPLKVPVKVDVQVGKNWEEV